MHQREEIRHRDREDSKIANSFFLLEHKLKQHYLIKTIIYSSEFRNTSVIKNLN